MASSTAAYTAQSDPPLAGTCPFCGATASTYWPKAHFSKCPSCHLIFRDPPPSTEQLDKVYNESWQDPVSNRRDTGGTNTKISIDSLLHLLHDLQLKDISGLRLLDFGAGKGEMLRILTGAGATASGVDLYGCDFLRRQGLDAYRTLDEIPVGTKFDGILASDVIEHLSSPWEELRRFADLLVPGGWLYISTPNPVSLKARLTGSSWIQARLPGHLTFFTPRTLDRMLRGCGFSRCRRLHWLIGYGHTTLRRCGHYALQTLSLDGELKYLGYRDSDRG